MKKRLYIVTITLALFLSACTQETQNKLSRGLQNWTGVHGVLDVYMGEKLVSRFIEIDKLTTATSTNGNIPRNYRYGYGYLDVNQNYQIDKGEKKIYFEISNYSTPYIFYTNPKR